MIEADGTPTTIKVTSTITVTPSQGDPSGQSQPMEVSPPAEQTGARAAAQPAHHQLAPDTHPTEGEQQQSVEQTTAPQPVQPETVSQVERQESKRLRQEKTDKLTRIMLEIIYRSQPGVSPAADIVNQAVLNFASYASQYSQLAEARSALPRYAEKCMKNHYNHYAQRAMMGYDDDQELMPLSWQMN